MNFVVSKRAGGANLPQPVPFVVPWPLPMPAPFGPDAPAPEISEPPLPGHFPLLGASRLSSAH